MNYIKNRKIWFSLSIILLIFSIFSIVTKGFNFGTDFTGGTAIIFRLDNKDITLSQVRTAIGNEEIEITRIDKDFIVKMGVLSAEEKKAFLEKIQKELGGYQILEEDTVGPSIGKKLSEESLLILILAISGMLIYVTFRFEFWYGLSAIAALLHDMILTLGLISWLQLNVNTAMIAALLTIIGYSINDTIIVFDRVREKMRDNENRKRDIADVTNEAVNSTLVRCINTVLTTLFTVSALYFFGGITIKEFALVLLMGFIFGAYSSIFIASPLYVVLKKAQE